jgi:lipid-A-disaccharide synthase
LPNPQSPIPNPGSPTIALIAGEDSGDQLGADLIAALRRRYPGVRLVGIGGTRMAAQGFQAWHDIGELSLFGFSEVVTHLPRLLRLRRSLVARLLALRPDAVVGIDAPDFNLGLERRLKASGIRTVHYVSPSIWAWREKRAASIGHSADRVLCLFPMEPAIYARHGVDARFVGHPLADRFSLVADRGAARAALGLAAGVPVLAVLPGSRLSELSRLGEIFLAAAAQVAAELPGLRVVIPAANAQVHARLTALLAHSPLAAHAPLVLDGRAHEAMLAADVVLLASGTATLEAMLAKRRMVVGYRVSPLSYRIARWFKLLKTDIYSLPNVLARALEGPAATPVPELMQDACTASNLAGATRALLRDSERRAAIVTCFERLHRQLRGDGEVSAGERAAQAIAELIDAASQGSADAGR